MRPRGRPAQKPTWIPLPSSHFWTNRTAPHDLPAAVRIAPASGDVRFGNRGRPRMVSPAVRQASCRRVSRVRGRPARPGCAAVRYYRTVKDPCDHRQIRRPESYARRRSWSGRHGGSAERRLLVHGPASGPDRYTTGSLTRNQTAGPSRRNVLGDQMTFIAERSSPLPSPRISASSRPFHDPRAAPLRVHR